MEILSKFRITATPTSSDEESGPVRSSFYWQILIVFGMLLVARILAIFSVYFYEEDEISIAAGAAALVRGNVGDLYRYTPHLGYYRLVEYIDLALGGNVTFIPGIMKGLSALAGALIPVAGMFAFCKELNQRERWLVTLSLAINPIIWKSSQYGNAAMVATAFATLGLVILSNRPGPTARIGALALFGIATVVRADTVLLAPIAFFLLYRQEGRLRQALMWSGAFGLVMAMAYSMIFALDSRIDSTAAAVVRHMSGLRGEFWEYLLWAMSPIPLIFAISGMNNLLESRPGLFASLALWCIPTMLFYFMATTTPRYFLNCALPLSMAAAVGINEMAGRLKVWLGERIAWLAAIGFASVHLVLALGHFSYLGQIFRGAFIITHDRAMPTGALLAVTYFDPNVLVRSLPDPQFGRRADPFWEPLAFAKAIGILSDGTQPNRTVIILLAGGWAHAFHYHAQAAGAIYISRAPSYPSWPFSSETWLELGNARVMTVNSLSHHYQALERFDVERGDQVWVLGDAPFPNSAALSKVPPGLSLVPAETFDKHFRVFRVAKSEGIRP